MNRTADMAGVSNSDEHLDNTTEVETPERIRFRYQVAGPARRYLAYLLDVLIRAAIGIVVFIVLSLISGGAPDLEDMSQGMMLVSFFVLEWGYYVFFETLGGGRTPGKRALGLRVVKEGGHPINFVDSILRNLLRAADFLPSMYLIGALTMAADRRFRRLGDLVAGTMVVIEENARVQAPFVLNPAAQQGELESLPSRPPLSFFERESIELFLRREYLSIPRRLELAEQIAPRLAERMGFGPGNLPGGDAFRFLALIHLRLQPGRAAHPETRAPA